MSEELNEDCGCGSNTEDIRSFTGSATPRYSQDPLVGKNVSLSDGRKGLVDDSIRNGTGEVIGYVIEGNMGKYRVFKNKIAGVLDESGGPMATLPQVPGMGNVVPPTRGKEGSGDQFPSLTVGTPAASNKKKIKKESKEPKKDPNPIDTSLMNYKSFISSSKKNQG